MKAITASAASVLMILCMVCVMCGIRSSRVQGQVPAAKKGGGPVKCGALSLRYTKIFWGTLKTKKGPLGGEETWLVDAKSILGKVDSDFPMPCLASGFRRNFTEPQGNCLPAFIEAPYIYVDSRRYMVFIGSHLRTGNAQAHAVERILRIIDLDEPVWEAKARQILRVTPGVSALPGLRLDTTDTRDLDLWFASARKKIEANLVSVRDVIRMLGQPDDVVEEGAHEIEIKAIVYLLDSRKLKAVTKLKTVLNEEFAVTYECPRLTFSLDGESVVGVRRDKYSVILYHARYAPHPPLISEEELEDIINP